MGAHDTQGSEPVLRRHEDIIAMICPATRTDMSAGDAVAWLRRQGAVQFANRLRAALRGRNAVAHPDSQLRSELESYLCGTKEFAEDSWEGRGHGVQVRHDPLAALRDDRVLRRRAALGAREHLSPAIQHSEVVKPPIEAVPSAGGVVVSAARGREDSQDKQGWEDAPAQQRDTRHMVGYPTERFFIGDPEALAAGTAAWHHKPPGSPGSACTSSPPPRRRLDRRRRRAPISTTLPRDTGMRSGHAWALFRSSSRVSGCSTLASARSRRNLSATAIMRPSGFPTCRIGPPDRRGRQHHVRASLGARAPGRLL